MVRYDLKWLESKGFFRKTIPVEVMRREVLIDDENLLAYVEVYSDEEIGEIKRELLSQKIKYIWFFFPNTGRLKVFRRVGEIKWFYYSTRMKGHYLKSRIDKLKSFSPGNMNILFDIRDIVEKFYWQLWEHRILMAKNIKVLRDDKNKLLVVQHLIDRLIFFYFLAQLRLVKIKNEEKEWVLDRRKTREFFKWICNQLTEDDLQEFLNKIFFEVLGEVRKDGFVSKEFDVGGERFYIVSPCLNGGLFIENKFEGIPEGRIKVSGIKKLILRVLNNYNWIIGEEFPEEEDVIGDLTPEIIGHIYEKFVVSLEQIGLGKINLKNIQTVKEELRYGRKKIGAYYTPEEITNYISINTIYPYIEDRLEEKFGKEGKTLFENLFKKDIFGKRDLEIIKYLYFEILTKIKICDNACGSGSFLIAAGDVLLKLYSRVLDILEENLSDDEEVKKVLKEMSMSLTRNYYIVRQIIVNNLYGVDIMDGAVEIAKLRFWLWLISQVDPKRVEGKKIETLPNLDFNLMTGNSLIGFIDIEDVDFDFIRKQRTLAYWLGESKLEWLKNLAKKKREFKTMPGHKAVKLKEKLNKEIDKARKFLNERFYNILKTKGIKISKKEFLKLKPFHWGFEFYEVFDLEKPKEKRGFDIIIGNPPYGNILRGDEKKICGISYISKYNEISGLFVERSTLSLKKSGYFAYVITYAITFNKDLSRTRELLYHTFDEVWISSFDRDRCRFFEGMSQSVSILICKNKLVVNKIDNKVKATFYTSRMFRAMPKSLSNIKHSIANEYLFTDEGITNKFNTNHRLPKIGERINYMILEKIVENRKLFVKDIIDKGNSIIWIRTSGNYWYNAWDKKPYISSEIRSLNILEVWKDFLIVLMNTSLFYWWLRVYGDGRHMNMDLLKGFPLPNEEKIIRSIRLLRNLRKLIMDKIFSVFEHEKNRFRTSEVKDILDVADIIIGMKYYNLSVNEILWIINTDFEVRGGIKLPEPLYRLAQYIHFLEASSLDEKEKSDLIKFLKNNIVDTLIYDLIFKEEFYRHNIISDPKEYFTELISKYLEPIIYNRWSTLYWKKRFEITLNKKEQEEIKKLEQRNFQVIKEVIGKIKKDKIVTLRIEQIKSHPWIKAIEGE